MGLPQINIEFIGKALTALRRSELGIVALILKDDTQTLDTVTYTGFDQVIASEWSAENADYIEQAFLGEPSKVIVERVASAATDYSGALARLNNKRFNYLAIPGIEIAETAAVVTWIKTKRDDEKKTFKAVLPDVDGDHEGIINFTTDGIKVGATTYTTAEYTARVAGALAGLPFTRSATYLEFPEVDSITEIASADTAIDNGELILINDGENIKIGRGVNSLTTIKETSPAAEKTSDFQSIRVVEVMDMIKDDIRTTFEKEYVGKVNNTYDNQVLFITSVNAYFDGLEAEEILDPTAENIAFVDVNAQRAAWESAGVDTSDWDDAKVKETSFKRHVFLSGTIKIVDAMEDLDFEISI